MVVELATAWTFFGQLLFGSGWWSLGIWLSILVGSSVPYVLAQLGPTGMRSDLTIFILVGFGPLGAIFLFEILAAVADPEPACTEECWGRAWLGLIALIGFVAWEFGVRRLGAQGRT